MSESQYIPDPDELEDDAAGEQDELYEHYSITADRGQSPLRLDKFLTIHMERCSRNRIQTAADAGNILVNGKPAKSSYKVKPGDRISLVMPYPKREIEIIPETSRSKFPTRTTTCCWSTSLRAWSSIPVTATTPQRS